MKSSSCWVWCGPLTGKGYGQIYDSRVKRGRTTHRISYEVHTGPIPAGKMVLHECDNPACVNPAHLTLGDNAKNMQDMISRGRGNKARGVKVGTSKLTPEAIAVIRKSSISRKELAVMFGVSAGTIYRARAGKSWGHVYARSINR